MAKIGEGDARWLVEDRADGANVNQWHWSEKDILPWVKGRVAELFNDLQVVEGIKVTGVKDISGEAFLNVRKKKLIPSYELDISLNWEGANGEASTSGVVHFPYVAEENHDEDPEMKVSTADKGAGPDKLRYIVAHDGKQVLLDAMQTLVKEINAGKPAGEAAAADAAKAAAPKPKLTSAYIEKEAPKKEAPKSSARSITLKEEFYCSAADLYECFTNPQKMSAFCLSPCTAEPRPGGAWTMYDGSVRGTYVELEPAKKLVQEWKFSSWDDKDTSKVTMTFEEPSPGRAVLKVKQTGIPYEDRFGNHDVVGNVEKGWQGQIFHRIRGVFGYGI